MPMGPRGQKRPVSTVANAVLVAKIATGEADEEYVSSPGQAKRVPSRPDALIPARRAKAVQENAGEGEQP